MARAARARAIPALRAPFRVIRVDGEPHTVVGVMPPGFGFPVNQQVWLPLAVLGVGLVALFLATFDRPGIGLVVTGVVAGLTAFTALLVRPAIPEGAEAPEGSGAEETPKGSEGAGSDAPEEPAASRTPDRYRHAWSAVYGVLAAVLLATAALRDAGWVLAWTLTGAFFLASLAFAVHNPAARGNTAGVAAGSLALLRNAPAALVFLGRPLARLKASNRMFVPALVTAGMTAGLLVVFGALFAFADPVFAAHLESLFSAPEMNLGGLNPIAAVLTVLFTGAAVLAARHRRNPSRSLPRMFVEALPDGSEPSTPPRDPAQGQEEREAREKEPAQPWPVWV